jgi:hypothetical protein
MLRRSVRHTPGVHEQVPRGPLRAHHRRRRRQGRGTHPPSPFAPLTFPTPPWVARCHAWPANEYSTSCESAVVAGSTVSTRCASGDRCDPARVRSHHPRLLCRRAALPPTAAMVSPQHAQSLCRCGRAEPSSGVDAAMRLCLPAAAMLLCCPVRRKHERIAFHHAARPTLCCWRFPCQRLSPVCRAVCRSISEAELARRSTEAEPRAP